MRLYVLVWRLSEEEVTIDRHDKRQTKPKKSTIGDGKPLQLEEKQPQKSSIRNLRDGEEL